MATLMMMTKLTDPETEEDEEDADKEKMQLITSPAQDKWEIKHQENSNFLLKIHEKNL